MSALTDRQQAIFDFIVGRVRHEGIPPTLMEIAAAFGLTSPAGIADHLKAIERKGFIRRRPGASRGIEVADMMPAPGASSAWLPLAGKVPSAAWGDTNRSRPSGVVVDRRLARRGGFAVGVASSGLRLRSILVDDLLVVSPGERLKAGDLVIGRQGRIAACLEIGADGRSAFPLAGRFDSDRDIEMLGSVIGVLRGLSATPVPRAPRLPETILPAAAGITARRP